MISHSKEILKKKLVLDTLMAIEPEKGGVVALDVLMSKLEAEDMPEEDADLSNEGILFSLEEGFIAQF